MVILGFICVEDPMLEKWRDLCKITTHNQHVTTENTQTTQTQYKKYRKPTLIYWEFSIGSAGQR